jgi:hypothetical protein
MVNAVPKSSQKQTRQLNREWHELHKMPPTATLEQRLLWHLEHQRECACREVPKSLASYLAARKTNDPEKPADDSSE